MFRPIHLLPKPDNLDKILEYKERWESEPGKKCYNFIINKIKEGGGEDFLQWDFQEGPDLKLIMEDEWDLKGIKIWELDINFPQEDNFENMDFSYAKFWHSKFKNATFSNTYFGFSKLYNCEFKNCLFGFTNFYGAKFEKVKFENCSFIEYNSFNNCDFIECEFDNFFTDRNLFIDCNFDVNTIVKKISFKPIHDFRIIFEKQNLSNIYKGIKDSYLSGEVFDKYREYYFKQKRSETKYTKRGMSKIGGYFVESLAGYGVRPLFTLGFIIIVIFIFTLIYYFKFPLPKSLLMSLSALTTMGEVPNVCPYNFFYILESTIGIFLFALFVTILANIWFSEK